MFETVGQRLKRLREDAGHTQRSLSKVSGVSHRTIHSIESGLSKLPRYVTLKALATALKVSVDDLGQS